MLSFNAGGLSESMQLLKLHLPLNNSPRSIGNGAFITHVHIPVGGLSHRVSIVNITAKLLLFLNIRNLEFRFKFASEYLEFAIDHSCSTW